MKKSTKGSSEPVKKGKDPFAGLPNYADALNRATMKELEEEKRLDKKNPSKKKG